MIYDIYGKNRITGHYGDKRDYYKPGRFHQGDDIALPMDSPIYSRADGTIIKIGFDPEGYGNYIVTDYGNGLTSLDAHANGFDVKVGDRVTGGQVIGRVGSTGRSTGPHRHHEIRLNGKSINPRDFAKYFVFSDTVKPKGIETMTQTPINMSAEEKENLMNQIAQMQAENELNRFKRTPEEEELKKQTIANLLTKLEKPVETPGNVTIADLLNGNKSLNGRSFTFERSPEIARGLNAMFGTSVFDPKTGRVIDLAEPYVQRQENERNRKEAVALEQQKIQNLLANNVYNAMNRVDEEAMREDRFNRQMAMQNEHYRNSLLAAQKAAAEKRAQQEFENDLKQKEFDLKQKELEAKLNEKTAEEKKEEAKIKENNKAAELIYKQLDALQNEFNKLPQATAKKGTQKGTAILTGLANQYGGRNDNVAGFVAIRNPLTTSLARTIATEKGVLTDKDFERASAMLPSVYDSPQQAEAKLKAVKNLVFATYGISADDIPEGLKEIEPSTGFLNKNKPIDIDDNEIEKELKRRGL